LNRLERESEIRKPAFGLVVNDKVESVLLSPEFWPEPSSWLNAPVVRKKADNFILMLIGVFTSFL